MNQARPRPRTRQRPTPAAPATPSLNIEPVPIDQLKRADRQLRRRKKALIEAHAANITTHGYAPPLLALRSGDLIQGHDHLEAYHLLNRSHVPVIFVDDRPPEQVAAMKLWLERFDASGDWDWDAVAAEFELICEIDPQWLTHTLWETAEIDLALLRGGLGEEPPKEEEEDEGPGPACAMSGDLFQWDAGHRLLVGNARDGATVARLMDGRLAQIAALDPPYGTTVSRISSKHPEFLEGSGMDEVQSQRFFEEYLAPMTPALADGALTYTFIDWAGLLPMLLATKAAGLKQLAFCTWDKLSPGLGSLYRSQTEHIVVAKHGEAPHQNNIQLGAFGRSRSNLWQVPGYAGFRPDRKEALENHSCTKPQALFYDILLDASNPGDICLDVFCGSGSSLLAAHRLKRLGYGVEIDGKYVDIAVRRMHKLTGDYPLHLESGLRYDELLAERNPHRAESFDAVASEAEAVS